MESGLRAGRAGHAAASAGGRGHRGPGDNTESGDNDNTVSGDQLASIVEILGAPSDEVGEYFANKISYICDDNNIIKDLESMRGEDTALALAVRTAQVSHTLYSNVCVVGMPGSVHFYCIVLYRFKGQGESYTVQ